MLPFTSKNLPKLGHFWFGLVSIFKNLLPQKSQLDLKYKIAKVRENHNYGKMISLMSNSDLVTIVPQ